MHPYRDLFRRILDHGAAKGERTGRRAFFETEFARHSGGGGQTSGAIGRSG
jgi:hypothetical protein